MTCSFNYYVESFEQKWVLRRPASSDELLGAADSQSLADLGTSYALVHDMRSVPFGLWKSSTTNARTKLWA